MQKILQNIIFFLFFIFPSLLFSQNKVSGQVFDTENYPIEFATIQLQTENSISAKNVLSDEFGKFEIEEKSGNYMLQISFFGNILFQKNINLIENVDLGIIKVENSILLDGVEITANSQLKLKKELGKYVVQNIANSQFSKGKSGVEVLKYVPILNTDENGISILNKGEATILINGKRIGNKELAYNMIKSIPANDIQKIEIISNPDSKYDANSKNGIINVILKNNENDGFRGSVSATTNQSYYNSQYLNGFVSYSKKKLTVTSGISAGNNNFFSRNFYEYNNKTNNSQSQISSTTTSKNKNLSFFVNSDYKLNDQHSIGLQIGNFYSDRNSDAKTENTFKPIDNTIIDSTSVNYISRKTPDYNSLRGNFNYSFKVDTLGSSLNFDHTIVNVNSETSNHYSFINSNSADVLFLQNPNENWIINSSKLDFTKVFNEDSKLFLGLSYTFSNIKNDFFHGNFNGSDYVSDPNQTNNFKYIDDVLAFYISYEKVINDKWEASIGLRFENFNANGKTDTNPDQTKIENTYLFPSFSLLFMANDNHEFSLDFGSSIFRPYYTQLNPFIKYTSSNSYTINNPNLLPSLSYEATFDYTFFEKYTLNIDYSYDKNLFNDFDIVLPDNSIQTTTANYGNSNYWDFNFIYSENFFNKNWNFSAIANYTYDKTKGSYNNIDMDYENSSYSIKLKNQINLSKNKDFNASFIYGYSSKNRSVLGTMKSLHSLIVDITKTYKNFNFTFSASDLAMSNIRLEEDRPTYSFYKKIDYFRNYSLSVRYNFGNKKVKRVEEKSNEINNRLL
jgi:hypothetical protein